MLEERDDGSRYRMLETIRDYAAEKLKAEADEAAAGVVRHCDYYLQLAQDANDGMDGAEQARWLTRLEAESDNLRAAMSLALAEGVDPVIAVKLAVAMQGFWILRGYSTEGRRLVKAALELPAVQGFSLAKAHALYVGAALASCQSDHAEALKMLETSLAIHRELGDPENIAATLSTLSAARLESGDMAGARADEVEAIELFRQLGQRLNEVIGLCNLGQIALFESDLGQARARLTEGLVLARDIESSELEGECELWLGDVELDAGSPRAASEHFQRSLAVCQEGADKRGVANAQWRLGELALGLGDYAAARQRLDDALVAFHSAEMWKEVFGCLEGFAGLAHLAGLHEVAVRIAAATTLARQRLGLVRRPAAEKRWQARLEALRQPLRDEVFVAAWNEAWDQWETEDAIRSARDLPQALETASAP
jgi:tetratricopeptide (TPR) repeat protein